MTIALINNFDKEGDFKMSFNKRQSRKQRSKGNFRETKETICVFCEGQTEVLYLEYWKNKLKLSNLHIETIELKKKGNPLTLAKSAIQSKNSLKNNYDSYYIVFDRDLTTNADLFQNSLNNLKNNQIINCHSFPSFELWFLLHFQNLGEARLNNTTIIEKLSKHLKFQYNKEKKIVQQTVEILYPHTQKAIQRAKNLNENGNSFHTCLYKLMEKLIRFQIQR